MNSEREKKIVQFLFEMGTMRKLPRMHRQLFLFDDFTDNIATHSYRVTIIGWFLAKLEGADPYKVSMMCLIHDMPEVRTGDHNWLHKRYTKIFENEIKDDQLGNLPFNDFKEISDEYEERTSKESIIAKDADLLDQIFLLREYAWQGNKEAQVWLDGRSKNKDGDKSSYKDRLKTESAKKLYDITIKEDPNSWWYDLATSKNR